MTASTRCGRCSAPLVEIDVASGDGHVVLQSCSACDTRWWQVDGQQVPVSEALGRVRPAKAKAPKA